MNKMNDYDFMAVAKIAEALAAGKTIQRLSAHNLWTDVLDAKTGICLLSWPVIAGYYRVKPAPTLKPYTFDSFPRSAAWIGRDDGCLYRILALDSSTVWYASKDENGPLGVAYTRLMESGFGFFHIIDSDGKELPGGVEVQP